jgi:EAL domain-containing protein (putative c-di-GMP-specific phosphodiesterase class I)
MSDATQQLIERAMHVDEVGIAYGSFAGFRLRAAHRPVFALRGEMLEMVGAEGLVLPFRDGVAVSADRFLGEIDPAEADAVHGLLQAIVLQNHAHVSDEISLFLECSPLAGTAAAALAERAAEAGVEPHRLVSLVRGNATQDADEAARLVTDLHARGFSVAVDQRSAGHMLFDPMHAAAPDVVRIDGAWLAGSEFEPRVAALLGRFIVAMRQLGMRSLVVGLSTPAQLAGALAAGADMVQGPVLAPVTLTGADVEDGPMPIADLLGRKVALLSAGR